MKTSKSAVVLVDMQDFFLKRIELKKRKELIESQIMVLKFCAKQNIPVVVLEYEGKARGRTISSLQSEIWKVPTTATIRKPHNSGFRDTMLDSVLKEWGIRRIALMGINGSGCVQDTAIGALGRGYKVITARGVIASSSVRDRDLATSKKWFSVNAQFLEGPSDLISSLA